MSDIEEVIEHNDEFNLDLNEEDEESNDDNNIKNILSN